MFKVKSIDKTEFGSEVLSSSLPVVVDFFAGWCPPCRRLGPILERLATEFDGRIKFVKVDVEQQPELAEKFMVTSLPTMVFFQNGLKVGQVEGLPYIDTFRSELGRWSAQKDAG